MVSGSRIRKGEFIDADVLAIYMKYRDSHIGPFTREVGNFIAHSKRDRGATLDAIAYTFAQLAFLQTYQGKNSIPLDNDGRCGWWLKPYFLGKVEEFSTLRLAKEIGIEKSQAKKAIESWFNRKKAYPTQISCRDRKLFYSLTKLFCSQISAPRVFEFADAVTEIQKIFTLENIPHDQTQNFLVGTCVLLSNKKTEIVPGVSALVELAVGTHRYLDAATGKEWRTGEEPAPKYVKYLPDGNLKLLVTAENNTGDGLVSVAMTLLETDIDTEPFFSRALIKDVTGGFPSLDFSEMLSFDSKASPKVSAVM